VLPISMDRGRDGEGESKKVKNKSEKCGQMISNFSFTGHYFFPFPFCLVPALASLTVGGTMILSRPSNDNAASVQ